jgi:hypothetical protein
MKKKCNKCEKEKPLDDFHNAPHGLHLKSNMCKKCRSQYAKELAAKKKMENDFERMFIG